MKVEKKFSILSQFWTGYYGDALAPKKGDCKQCLCYPYGTLEFEDGESNCDQLTGQCKCKPYVTGINCDQCEPGYYDINSGLVKNYYCAFISKRCR